MFHFSRRTLWIIIYVTIPLIFVLNSLGPDEAVTEKSLQGEQLWSLDAMTLTCENSLCFMSLDGSPSLLLSVISDKLPDSQLDVPDELTIQTGLQGGYFVATFKIKPTLKNLKITTRFIQNWLPYSNKVQVVVSGDVSDAMKTQLESLISSLQGSGIPNVIEPVNGLAVLQSPVLGGGDQLSFLMWVEVLKNRLAGYDVIVKWDHRRQQSYVVFNSTLAEDIFYPVESEELAPILSAYIDSAQIRVRSFAQLHRYAVTASVYQLPLSFFIDQPSRLGSISVESVNQMREFALGQVKKSR